MASSTHDWDLSRLPAQQRDLAPGRVVVEDRPDAALLLDAAEAAADAHRPDEALRLVEDASSSSVLSPALRLRALLVEAWARIAAGDPGTAEKLIEQARWMADGPSGTDRDRVEVLFRLGCCRLRQAKVGNATALLTVAFEDAQRTGCGDADLLATILQWRARCWLRQNLLEMATQDVELALEHAEAARPRVVADVSFQASIVAERRGEFLLARMYAESALDAYRGLDDGDGVIVDKVLNNLGGINVLLGDYDGAVRCLTDSLQTAREHDDEVGVGFALSTLAETHLRMDRPDLAEGFARQALATLERIPTQVTETGCVLLTLGRAKIAQGRLEAAEGDLRHAEDCFRRSQSSPHQAEAWIAQGDLAEVRGDLRAAADRYRRAAIALRNVHL